MPAYAHCGKSAGAPNLSSMCHFITLVAPTEDAAAVRMVMERHGRAAEPIDNASVRKVLRDDERQYVTTCGHCDCGTALAPRHDTPEAHEEKLAKETARMRRKGWSEAKVARALEDRLKADARPRGGGSDSLELWHGVLRELREELKLPYVGLFVRFYSGAIATETFKASRRRVPKDAEWQDALGSIEHDEVTIFPLSWAAAFPHLRTFSRGKLCRPSDLISAFPSP
jgi:hypothetical protein